MLSVKISAAQLAQFQAIKRHFLAKTPPLVVAKWSAMSDSDIWLRIVSQVVVVGREAPAHRLKDVRIQASLSFESLAAMPSSLAAKTIGKVLGSIKARWVSTSQPLRAPKVRALAKNLEFLKRYPGGPRGLVRDLAAMGNSRERVTYIHKHLAYLKSKGARDFLTTGLGMATDVIALDSRVMRVVTKIVPTLPPTVTPRNYDTIEATLINQVCRPLEMSPGHFDQLLFHNQREIQAFLLTHRTPTVLPDLAGVALTELVQWRDLIRIEIKRRARAS